MQQVSDSADVLRPLGPLSSCPSIDSVATSMGLAAISQTHGSLVGQGMLWNYELLGADLAYVTPLSAAVEGPGEAMARAAEEANIRYVLS